MKGVYLAACKARHPNFDIIYNDIDPKFKPDILGDMLSVDLTPYDFVIASPPCNWWSKANPCYKTSTYSLNTKHLLPDTIKRLAESGLPFVIENVKNKKRMVENGIFDICGHYGLFYQFVGRHIYITNIFVDLDCPQIQDFKMHGKRVNNDGYNQGGTNVHNCIEIWLKKVTAA